MNNEELRQAAERVMQPLRGLTRDADARALAEAVLQKVREEEIAALIRVGSHKQMVKVASELGLSDDWDDPERAGVSAEVRGVQLGSSGNWAHAYSAGHPSEELHVILSKEGSPYAAVNLSDLFSWAAEDYQ